MSLFDNLGALFTSLGSSERQELEVLWKQHGGKVVAVVTPNDPPHVVITRRVGSSKYISLMRRHPNTHVVAPEWIRKSIEMKKKQPYSQFRVGALYGLKICLSGFDVDKKALLADLISRNGGIHSPSLTKFCTHLVSTDRTTQKYTFAVKHGIICCSLDWLVESTKGSVKWCRDATKYHVKDSEMSLIISNRADTCDLDTFAAVNVSNAAVTTNKNVCSEADGGTQGNSIHGDSDRRMKFGVSAPKSRPSRLEHDANVANHEGTVDQGDGDKGNGAKNNISDANDDAIESEESLEADHMFLKDCGIWSVGLSPTELKELVSMCCMSGATRISFSHPTLVTHILRGSGSCTPGEREEISNALHSRLNPPHLVNMDWLRACLRSGQELDADQVRFRPPKEEDSVFAQSWRNSGRSRSLHSALERLDSVRSTQGLVTQNQCMDQKPKPSMNHSPTNDASSGSLGLKNDGIFSGYYFTLCAVRGTSEEQIAEVLIRQHGGKINNSSVPASGEGTLLAICPSSLTRIESSRLRSKNNSNFCSVPDDNRFTLYWIKCCVKAQKMLVHQDGAPCFRPLPFELPMEGTHNISISTSGYDEDVKSAIKYTVETIGGRFSVRNMSANDTHLIVPFAHGEKYRHSERLGVIPVTSQWLVESVKAGRILPEARFRPGPKPGCVPDTLVPGNRVGNMHAMQSAAEPSNLTISTEDSGGKRGLSTGRQSAMGVYNQAFKPAVPEAFKRAKTDEIQPATNQATKPKKWPSGDPANDDLDKAGMQVTSLVSRLQTTGNRAHIKTGPAWASVDNVLTKASAARPSKRSSTRRVGLHKPENDKTSDDRDQQFGQVLEMVEVSQRVGYVADD